MTVVEICETLSRLRPGCQYVVRKAEYSSIEWHSTDLEMPSELELLDGIEAYRAEIKATAYKKLRAAEYPPIEDYLDAVVKGDQEQLQAYINACLAVKEKYPKG